jgi:hypothetical protein
MDHDVVKDIEQVHAQTHAETKPFNWLSGMALTCIRTVTVFCLLTKEPCSISVCLEWGQLCVLKSGPLLGR